MTGRDGLRPAAQLLVECVAPGDDVVADDLVPEVDVRDLARAADEHRVLPALARLLLGRTDVDPAWYPALVAARREQAVRHVRAVADAAALGAVLDASGIPWAVAKGPVVASVLWPAADMRQYYDLDVYVPREHFAAAVRALEDAGCTEEDRNWPLMLAEMRAEYALRSPGGTHVDLHWDIAVPRELRARYRTDLRAMIARRRLVDVGGGRSLWTFDVEDTAFLLAFHAAQAGANKLVWLADVRFAVLDPTFDPVRFAERAAACRASVPVALVLDRADRVLGLGLGPQRRDELGTLLRGTGMLGRVARYQDRRSPFPGLPGDKHLGGGIYAGARSSPAASAVTMLRNRLRTRAVERAVRADPRAAQKELRFDVPDAAAKAEYLARSSQVTRA